MKSPLYCMNKKATEFTIVCRSENWICGHIFKSIFPKVYYKHIVFVCISHKIGLYFTTLHKMFMGFTSACCAKSIPFGDAKFYKKLNISIRENDMENISQ